MRISMEVTEEVTTNYQFNFDEEILEKLTKDYREYNYIAKDEAITEKELEDLINPKPNELLDRFVYEQGYPVTIRNILHEDVENYLWDSDDDEIVDSQVVERIFGKVGE